MLTCGPSPLAERQAVKCVIAWFMHCTSAAASVAVLVQAHRYGEAFELTSNNRVDLNVIVDYAWPQFLSHAADFVQEVQVSHTTCVMLQHSASSEMTCCIIGE